MKQTKEISKLLDEAKIFWICPVTGTKIEASDTAAIAAHKQKLIDKEKEQKRVKEQKKLLKNVQQKLFSISTLDELNDITKQTINIMFPNVADKNVPVFSVPVFADPKITNKNTRMALIKIDNYNSKLKTAFPHFGFKTYTTPNKEVFAIVNDHLNPLAHKIFDYQTGIIQANTKSVGMEEKAILQTSKEYVSLTKDIQAISKQLHELKEAHAEVNGQMKKLRTKILGEKTFDDFLTQQDINPKTKMKNMFIRPLKNSTSATEFTPAVPDITFSTKQELLEFIKKQPQQTIQFSGIFKNYQEQGYLINESISVVGELIEVDGQQEQFSRGKNCFYFLNKRGDSIKKTLDADFCLNKEQIQTRIWQINSNAEKTTQSNQNKPRTT